MTAQSEPRNLVVKLTAGGDSPERASQALTVAAVAVAAGASVSVWLTGESAWFALAGRADPVTPEHSAPLGELLASVLAEGTVTVCVQCAARRGITEADLLPGVRLAGATVFVAEALAPGAQALVY